MIWRCICWEGVGTMMPVDWNKYSKVSRNFRGQFVARSCKTFPSRWVHFSWRQRPRPLQKIITRIYGKESYQMFMLACSVSRLKYCKKRLPGCSYTFKRNFNRALLQSNRRNKENLIENIQKIWIGI